MAKALPVEAHDDVDDLPPIQELSREEGIAFFDAVARFYLGMSGEDFLRQWDAGTLDDPGRSEVFHVSILIPFAR